MKRATITITDDLADSIEQYRCNQDPAPDVTTVFNAAVRQFLVERGYLPSGRILRLTPALSTIVIWPSDTPNFRPMRIDGHGQR